MRLIAFLASLVLSLSAHALPVGLPHAGEQAESDTPMPYADLEVYDRGRFVSELFSDSASAALTQSLRKTQRLALGLATEGDFVRKPASLVGRGRGLSGGAGQPGDPLAGAIEQAQPARSDAAGEAAPGDVREFEHGADAEVLDADREVLARVEELRSRINAAVDWALDPEVDARGTRVYHVGGLGAVRVGNDGGFGFREAGFAVTPRPAPLADGSLPPGGAAWGDPDQRNAMLRLLFQLWDFVTHPLTLAAVLVFGLLRAVVSLAGGRPAAT